MNSKSVEAFRTIAEVADELDVPKHVLRFWEGKFPQIRPMKRGGGRRFYRPEDLELLRGIRALLHNDAYTIKGVQKILREQGVDHVKALGREPLAPTSKRKKAAARADAAASAGAAVATTAGTRGAAPARRGKAAAPTTARRQSVEAVIKELEACRGLLRDGSALSPASSGSRRARAAG